MFPILAVLLVAAASPAWALKKFDPSKKYQAKNASIVKGNNTSPSEVKMFAGANIVASIAEEDGGGVIVSGATKILKAEVSHVEANSEDSENGLAAGTAAFSMQDINRYAYRSTHSSEDGLLLEKDMKLFVSPGETSQKVVTGEVQVEKSSVAPQKKRKHR